MDERSGTCLNTRRPVLFRRGRTARGEDSERVQRYLVALLGTSNLLIPCLTAPSTPLKKAESIATLARRVDPQLPAKLVGFVLDGSDTEPSERLERILELLRSMPDTAGFRPSDSSSASLGRPDSTKGSAPAGEGNGNRTWFERRMSEEDPRVRATLSKQPAKRWPKTCGLSSIRPCRLKQPGSRQRAGRALSFGRSRGGCRSSRAGIPARPGFSRNRGVGHGRDGDTRFLPLLGRFLTDPNPSIKAAAFSAVRKLRGSENSQPMALDVRILGKPGLEGDALNVAFAVLDGCKPVSGIAATKVRILVNGDKSIATRSLSRSTIAVSQRRFYPRLADQARERSLAYRYALQECFEQRRMGDGWLFSQYSGSVARSTRTGLRLFSGSDG